MRRRAAGAAALLKPDRMWPPDAGEVMSDPCVLEPDEMNALIEINRMVDPTGTNVDDLPAGVVQQSTGSTSVCHWDNDYALVALTFEEYDETMFEMSRGMEGTRPVTGLGDDAFFDGFLDVLFVRVGDLDFQLQIVLPLTDMTREEVARSRSDWPGWCWTESEVLP